MRFSYIASIGAKSFVRCFFYKYSAPLELKILILLGFYKKPTLVNFSKGGIGFLEGDSYENIYYC